MIFASQSLFLIVSMSRRLLGQKFLRVHSVGCKVPYSFAQLIFKDKFVLS